MSSNSFIIKTVHTVLLLCSAILVWAQPRFISNDGQWNESFNYKVDLTHGALFFENEGYTAVVIDPEALEAMHPHPHEVEHHSHHNSINSQAYQMRWKGIDAEALKRPKGIMNESYYHNYFVGNQTEEGHSNVSVFKGLSYKNIYPGVTVNYYEHEGNLKYDIIINDARQLAKIRMEYSGLENLSIHEGRLQMSTALGDIFEYIPEAYQIVNGEKVLVNCNFIVQDSTVGFVVSGHDPNIAVVIDPVLDFSTFTGSTSDNWGFTATYDNGGNFYGGGIVFGAGYPTSLGAYQDTFSGGNFDVSISKFSPDGTALLYATFIGGNDLDVPHSMVVDAQDNLVILGSTGSSNFPTSSSAYQQSIIKGPNTGFPKLGPGLPYYRYGASAFLFKLNPSGTNMLASTIVGSNKAVGTNTKVYRNYGDNSRGEVIVLNNGNIAMTTSALADSLPFAKPNGPVNSSTQNAIVAVFNPSLSQLVWGSYYGGNGHETGYSVKTDGTNVFICGATASTDLLTHAAAHQPNNAGLLDGYIAKFNGLTGAFMGATHMGTSADEEAFFIDIDKHGAVLVFGLSKGSMPVTPHLYSNPGSRQFVQKYSNDLSTQLWSTVVGSGAPGGVSKTDMVPTAFMVDQCLKIYLSGWNGTSNSGITNGFGGNTNNMVTTNDAVQSSTDGSDLYFMVLEQNATGFAYGTYYGGTADEHVDGGTSRFSPEGVIYQAVCAACANKTFPTTPGVYSPTRLSNNCNLGAIKLSMEQTCIADIDIDFALDVDTTCDWLTVKFKNSSIHSNQFHWDFGNGEQSNQYEPTTIFKGLGTYTVTLIAEDTICDIFDTARVTIHHNKMARPTAGMIADYVGCNVDFEASFFNTSNEVNEFFWDFGDGTTSTVENPVHNFPGAGTYQVRLIARDTACIATDTVYETIIFQDTAATPDVRVAYDECSDGELDIIHLTARDRFEYEWAYAGIVSTEANPKIKFENPGIYTVSVSITDSLCGTDYSQNFKVAIEAIVSEIHIPNAFSPNGDGINEQFVLTGDACGENDYLKIYNRWGQIVFETNSPFTEFWDGNHDGQQGKEDVYTYSLQSGKEHRTGYLTLFR